jgi:hypothetical protein
VLAQAVAFTEREQGNYAPIIIGELGIAMRITIFHTENGNTEK